MCLLRTTFRKTGHPIARLHEHHERSKLFAHFAGERHAVNMHSRSGADQKILNHDQQRMCTVDLVETYFYMRFSTMTITNSSLLLYIEKRSRLVGGIRVNMHGRSG